MLFLLGIIDLLCTLSLVLLLFGYPLYPLQAGAALLLIGKGVLFFSDVLSILDIIAAVLILVLIWISLPLAALILAIYLGGKGTLSLI